MTESEALKILKISPEMKKRIPNLAEVYEVAVKALEEIQQYRAIGTIDEFKALKEKDTPKKPIIKEWCPAICPNCKQNLSESRGDGYWVHYTSLERCDCGQKLDWSE